MQTHPPQPSRRPLHSLFPLSYPQTPSRQKRRSSFVKYSPPSRMSALPSARTRYFDDQRAAAPVPASAAHPTTSVYSLSPTPSSRDLNSRASSSIALTFRRSRRSMPSSKGEPTDPELREKIKEEVKAEEKGGGEGKWSAWKAGEMARRYEAQGGDYEDKGDHKNKSQKGAPEKKEGK